MVTPYDPRYRELHRPHWTEPHERVDSIGRVIPCDYCGRNNMTNGSPRPCVGCGAPVQDRLPPRRPPRTR